MGELFYRRVQRPSGVVEFEAVEDEPFTIGQGRELLALLRAAEAAGFDPAAPLFPGRQVRRFPFDYTLETGVAHDLVTIQPGDLLFYCFIAGGPAALEPDFWSSDLGQNYGTLLMQLGSVDKPGVIFEQDITNLNDYDDGGGIGELGRSGGPFIADAGVPVTIQLKLVAPYSVLADDPPTLPLTVTAGVNDKWHALSFTFTVAPGTYTTAEEVAAAMEASEPSYFSDLQAVRVDDGKLRIFGGGGAGGSGGTKPLPGDAADNSHDFLAGAGFSGSESKALADWPVVALSGSATLVFEIIRAPGPGGSPPLG